MRASSLTDNTIAINREIDSKYDAVLQVRDSLPEIEIVAGMDLAAVVAELEAAQDFSGITVVEGVTPSWDAVNKVLTVPKGDKGDQGLQGLQGPKGEDGQTIVGPQGIGVHHIRGTNTTDLEGDFSTPGEKDTYTMYGDASETINIGYFTVSNGLKGDKGDKGDTGPKGDQGSIGPQGIQGLTGDTGAQGQQGTQGVKGDTGNVGPQGIQGIQGVKGDTGDTGPQGPKGDTGASVTGITSTKVGGTTTVEQFIEGVLVNTFVINDGVDGSGSGDMSKATYDTNGNGIVDNAEKVNGLTVETAVPIGAVFTDTVYDDTDVVKASLGVLPALDGSQLTNMPVALPDQAGFAGKYLKTDGTNASWESASTGTGITNNEFVATAGQTVFTATYTVGNLDVYQNGLLLSDTDYVATNGTSIILDVGATTGDLISVKVYDTFSVADAYTKAEIDAMVGNINSALDTINGQVI